MRRTWIQVLLVLVLAAIGLGVAGRAPHSATTQPASELRQSIDGRTIRDRTTPVLRGMTPMQRAHAEMFGRDFKSPTRLLDELLSVVRIDETGMFQDPSDAEHSPLTVEQLVPELACKVDSVFAGRVRSSVANPVDNGTFLFTDYTVTVSDVFRRAPAASTLTAGRTVVVTRPGGTMIVESTVVRAILEGDPELTTGKSYVFLAVYFPLTGSFKAWGYPTFEIRGAESVTLGTVARSAVDLKTDGIPSTKLFDMLRKLTCR